MISDAALAEVFAAELNRTRDAVSAIRVVRRTIEAHLTETTRRRCRRSLTGPVSNAQFDRVCALVAAETEMTILQVLRGANRDCLHARWIVAAVIRRFGLSYPQLARALDMTDHTRALDGVRGVDAHPEMAAARDRVLAALQRQGATA
jgi:AraC-like DNA-binding protein